VLAALEEVDRQLGTSRTGAFGGVWEIWAGDSAERYRRAGRDWLTSALALVGECRSCAQPFRRSARYRPRTFL